MPAIKLLDPESSAKDPNLLVPAGDRPVGVDKVGAGYRATTNIGEDFERKKATIKLKKVRVKVDGDEIYTAFSEARMDEEIP